MIYNTSKRFLPIYRQEITPPTPAVVPLTFIAKGNSTNAVQLQKFSTPSTITLQYSKNGGEWTDYTIGNIITLNKNETVAFSGNNDHFSLHFTGISNKYYRFNMSGSIEASGNIMSLMNFSDTCTSACFTYLFSGCASLITPPQLPATNLAPRCYNTMFKECSNLTAAPYLPATTLADKCYGNMFQYCSKISSIEVEFTTWSTATQSWFAEIGNTKGTFTKPASLPEQHSSDYIPNGWTVVNK